MATQKIELLVSGNAPRSMPSAMPLLYALRSDLDATAPKFGCGKAQCGACTVHLDGAPIRSCITPLKPQPAARLPRLPGSARQTSRTHCSRRASKNKYPYAGTVSQAGS